MAYIAHSLHELPYDW